MFKFVAICALLASATAQHHGLGHGQVHHDVGHAQSHGHASNHDDVHAEVKHFAADVHEHGFQYGYETSNSIKASAAGDEHGNHQGDFEWVSPEGEHINVKYVANEDGYQPQSNVLPTPHPIPEAILRAIKYIEAHPNAESTQHGQTAHLGQTAHHGGRRF